MLRGLLTLTACIACTACSVLPANGPNHRLIDAYASSSREKPVLAKNAIKYVLVDLDKQVVDVNKRRVSSPFRATFGLRRGSRARLRLGVGDRLTITIYESSPSGLFGVSNQAPGTPAGPPRVELPSQTVDSAGFITVPFSGDIKAAGKTVRQLQKDIQAKLSSRAVEPQVIVSLASRASSEVSVFGDASASNVRRVVNPGGERVLDLVASAGLSAPAHETFVTLRRGRYACDDLFPQPCEKFEGQHLCPSGGHSLLASPAANLRCIGCGWYIWTGRVEIRELQL